MLKQIIKTIRSRNMTTQTKAKGTKFFNEGTQNQQILANYWGNGKSFTSDDLLREEGFDVRVVESNSNDQPGRPTATYKIMKRRTYAS
jgi:hypothetical protein